MFCAVRGIGKCQASAGRFVCAEEAGYVVNSLRSTTLHFSPPKKQSQRSYKHVLLVITNPLDDIHFPGIPRDQVLTC